MTAGNEHDRIAAQATAPRMRSGAGATIRALRSRLLAILVVCVLQGACRAHYREFVSNPDSKAIDPGAILVVGVRSSRTGRIDPAASALLASQSGFEAGRFDSDIAELSLLLSDPGSLTFAAEERRALRERIGRRYALVGDVTTTPVDELSQWMIWIPIPIPLYIGMPIAFARIPITYDQAPDRPHASVVLRLVDLDTGRIDAEFFAVSNFEPGKPTLNATHIEAGLRSMKLRSNP